MYLLTDFQYWQFLRCLRVQVIVCRISLVWHDIGSVRQIWCHFLLLPTCLCLAAYLYSFNHWAKKYIYIYIYKVIQQNSFILMSGNLEILITWHLIRVDPKLKVSAFYWKKASSVKEADLRHLFVYCLKSVSLLICFPVLQLLQLWGLLKTHTVNFDEKGIFVSIWSFIYIYIYWRHIVHIAWYGGHSLTTWSVEHFSPFCPQEPATGPTCVPGDSSVHNVPLRVVLLRTKSAFYWCYCLFVLWQFDKSSMALL